MIAIFQASPNKTHDQPIKRIFRYLKGTWDFGLWYKKDGDFLLKAYTYVDWVESVDDRKSTNGGVLFLEDRLASWISKKQESASLSTIEAKYIAYHYG